MTLGGKAEVILISQHAVVSEFLVLIAHCDHPRDNSFETVESHVIPYDGGVARESL